ncbi:bark storage protein B-like [Mercurialis annua]|uniref:bark storage protein B-like n=1 Tax=Mercurialis annua TaxID=3986 RepID=UPI00216005E5|nr:bark storage protein B-like [Mercurialis annua]
MAHRNNILGLELAVVLIGLLAMSQPSMQLSMKHPFYDVIRRINEDGSFFGLVLVSDSNEKALLDSNLFVPTTEHTPTIVLAGRTFHIGSIKGANVVYVKSGEGIINAAATVQFLIDTFGVHGIVHFGSAGAVDDSLSIGDVVLVGQVAYTGSLKWKSFETEKGQLKFGSYNYPEEGENLLGSLDFQPSTLYTPSGKKKTVFWLPLDNSTWFSKASEMQNLEFEQCLDTTKCLPRAPVLVPSLKASTADLYLTNVAFREFVHDKFKVSIVDKETAAIVLVAITNEKPIIVFRGVSNTAGGSTAYKSYYYLASINAFKAAAAFIGTLSSETPSRATY